MKNKKQVKKSFIVINILLLVFTILFFISLFYLIGKSQIRINIITGIICLISAILVFFLIMFFKSFNKTPKINKQKADLDEFLKSDKIDIVDEKIIYALTNHDNISNSELKEPEQEDEASRFYMLTKIDKKMESYVPPKYDDDISLEEFCIEFRRFVASLAVTKLIILQGMSGTGKTSLAYAFGEFVDNEAVVIPIQPMWKERTDLIGYYNEFTKKFNETTMLCTLYEANLNNDLYALVLDEMNIARIEYYFAEFLSLLELPNPEGRNLDVVSDKWENDPKLLKNGKLRLPVNMWFIGTANNDDSTFAISDKVYDRAMVMNLDKKAKPFEVEGYKKERISINHLNDLIDKAQEEYSLTERNLRRIKQLDEYMIKTFHLTFGNRIMKQIYSYVPVMVACGGKEIEAIDDILARKVFRKLEAKNPVYVRQQAEGLINYINDLFGNNNLKQCVEVITTLEQN